MRRAKPGKHGILDLASAHSGETDTSIIMVRVSAHIRFNRFIVRVDQSLVTV